MDGLVSASGSSEDMALVKKLNALEVENKQLKKGKSFDKKSREGKTFIHLGGVIFWPLIGFREWEFLLHSLSLILQLIKA